MIKIKKGFEDKDRSQAAKLYVTAFKSKFENLIGSAEKVQAIFENTMNSDYCLCAYDENDNLLGIAGFQIGKCGFIDMKLNDFIKLFGILKGIWKAILIDIIFTREPESDNELLMDGIAVDSNYRGQGIGTQLFDSLIKYGEEEGYKFIKLDVIDRNPRAKALYEKIGFEAVKYEKVPKIISNRIGVTGVTSMVKKV